MCGTCLDSNNVDWEWLCTSPEQLLVCLFQIGLVLCQEVQNERRRPEVLRIHLRTVLFKKKSPLWVARHGGSKVDYFKSTLLLVVALKRNPLFSLNQAKDCVINNTCSCLRSGDRNETSVENEVPRNSFVWQKFHLIWLSNADEKKKRTKNLTKWTKKASLRDFFSSIFLENVLERDGDRPFHSRVSDKHSLEK